MKKLVVLTILFAFLTTSYGQDLIIGSNNSVTWGKDNAKAITIPLVFNTKVEPILMTIGYDTPNGIKFRVSFKNLNTAVDLRYVIALRSGLDEFGDCKQGYFVQVATHDFDKDNNPEVIIAVGNGLIDMSVNVIKYHPPVNSEDAIRTENWTTVANFQGQDKIYIKDQIITVPIGSQGLFDEYTWVKNKFVKTN